MNLATGKRIPKGVVTGIDIQGPVLAKGGKPRPWYWRVHFHADHPTARFGGQLGQQGKLLGNAHLPWEGLGAWYWAFPVQAPLVTLGVGATAGGGFYGLYRLADWLFDSEAGDE